MIFHDKETKTNISTDDPALVKRLRFNDRYEEVKERSLADERREQLSAMKRAELEAETTRYGIDATEFKVKQDFVDAVVAHEASLTDAGHA